MSGTNGIVYGVLRAFSENSLTSGAGAIAFAERTRRNVFFQVQHVVTDKVFVLSENVPSLSPFFWWR